MSLRLDVILVLLLSLICAANSAFTFDDLSTISRFDFDSLRSHAGVGSCNGEVGDCFDNNEELEMLMANQIARRGLAEGPEGSQGPVGSDDPGDSQDFVDSQGPQASGELDASANANANTDANANANTSTGQDRYISYMAMRANNVPCSERGQSYYNCNPRVKSNPYTRGCSYITHCARYTE